MIWRTAAFTLATLAGVASFTCTTPAACQESTTLTLPDALAMARARSAEMRAARARGESAGARADAALAGYLPSLAGQAGASQTWSRVTSVSRNPNTGAELERAQRATRREADASAALRWTAFDFWQTPSLVGSARADARAAYLGVHATANEITRNVASAYLTAVFDELLVENSKVTTQIRERHAAIAHGMVASGIRPSVEEARTRVELELARLETLDAERQTAQDKVRLATFLLLPPSTPFNLVRPPSLPTPTENPKDAALQAAANRPEVLAAAQSVEAREASLVAAKVARLPSIGASLEGTYHAPFADRDARTAVPTSTALTALVTVSVPVFDWRIWGQVPVASADVAIAEAERTGTLARVRGEAAEAAYGLQSARLVLEQSRSTRDLAGATLAVIEARYQAGLVTSTDLFVSTARDADARRRLIQSELGVALAVVQVLAATNRMPELER